MLGAKGLAVTVSLLIQAFFRCLVLDVRSFWAANLFLSVVRVQRYDDQGKQERLKMERHQNQAFLSQQILGCIAKGLNVDFL